jgi:hypothetical protein
MVGQATAVSDLCANPVGVADHSAASKRFRPGAQPHPLGAPGFPFRGIGAEAKL